MPILTCGLPPQAALARHRAAGAYVDCYVAQVPRTVPHAEFVAAFYTTWVFRIERWLLARMAARPSTDADALRLARGEADRFAAWSVEARGEGQLLLADFTGRTRSWLMTEALADGGTRLYFGSAVVPVIDRRTGRPALGPVFRALLGFHKLYSRLLLRAACRRLGTA